MKTAAVLCLAVVAAAQPLLAAEGKNAPQRSPAQAVVHTVFFSLKSPTPEAREKLIEACKKYLSRHEGQSSFQVGQRAEEYARDVNDKDFDVAITMVFRSREALDVYATHPRHLRFIEECKDGWKSVRVFDSYVSQARVEPVLFPLPPAAKGFAGTVKGKVVSKGGRGGIVVAVEEIAKTLESSKAQDPKSLVGKQVLIEPPQDRDRAAGIAAFLRILKAKDDIALEVAHKGGDVLTVAELTAEQRAKAEEEKAKAEERAKEAKERAKERAKEAKERAKEGKGLPGIRG